MKRLLCLVLCVAVLKLSVGRQHVLDHLHERMFRQCAAKPYATDEKSCKARKWSLQYLKSPCVWCPGTQVDARNVDNKCIGRKTHCINYAPPKPKVPARLQLPARNLCSKSRHRATESWMGQLPANKHFSELTLPGTHDAAVSGDISSLKMPIFKNLARCQSLTLAEQACEGARFFDIRVMWHGTKFEFLHPGRLCSGWSMCTRTHTHAHDP